MTTYVTTEDPRTVAACPDCDSRNVHHRGRAATDAAPYRCEDCYARLASYHERANRNQRLNHLGDSVSINPDYRGVSVPDTVYGSSRSDGVYHREDCEQLSDGRTAYRIEIARSWDTLSPCGYCIGEDTADPDADATGAPADD